MSLADNEVAYPRAGKSRYPAAPQQGLLGGSGRIKAIRAFHQGDMLDPQPQQIETFVKGAVAAAHHQHALARIGGAVANGAIMHFIGLGGRLQRERAAARGQDDGLRRIDGGIRFGAFFLPGQHQALHLADLLHRHLQAIHMGAHAFHQFHAVHAGASGKVLHRMRGVDQPAGNVAFQKDGAQIGQRAIDGRRHAGRAAADDQQIAGIGFLHDASP